MRVVRFIHAGSALIGILVVGLVVVAAVVACPEPRLATGMASVKGCELYYELAGEGPPVVFIHGGQLDRRMWDDQFLLFAQHFKVVRYDVRGYGPPKPHAAGTRTRKTWATCSDSWASSVRTSWDSRWAAASPSTLRFRNSHVASLVLAGSGLGGFGWSSADEEQIGRLIAAARDDGPEAVADLWLRDPLMARAMEQASLRERLRQLSVENAHAWLNNPLLRRRLDPPAIGRLAEIHVPVLLIVGSRDAPNIQRIAEKLEAGIAGARRVVIPDAGHLANMEKPDLFNHAVLGFLPEGRALRHVTPADARSVKDSRQASRGSTDGGDMGRSFTIGTLARSGGVSPDAIRYYERLGILKPVYRTASQYRTYDTSSIERLRFVRRAQELGLTLEDIGELVRINEANGLPAACLRVERRLRTRLESIESKIAALALFRRRLTAALSRCKNLASPGCKVPLDLASSDAGNGSGAKQQAPSSTGEARIG